MPCAIETMWYIRCILTFFYLLTEDLYEDLLCHIQIDALQCCCSIYFPDVGFSITLSSMLNYGVHFQHKLIIGNVTCPVGFKSADLGYFAPFHTT